MSPEIISAINDRRRGIQISEAGEYTACVKAVDVFGCDTSITVEVKV
jgi:hypothetical protein